MATIRLIPSTYYLSSTSYLSVNNIANAYENTDSETYATVTNSRSNTTSYYAYLRGFNFDDIPSNATINSFSIKLKVRESGGTTSSTYQPQICNGTTVIAGSGGTMSTSVKTITFTGVTDSWETIKGYGENFGIRVNCRRNSATATSYIYLYGAEILVDYTVPSSFNYIKVNGVFRKIKKTFKMQNSAWAEIEQETFKNYIGSNVLLYGGHSEIFLSFEISAPSAVVAETCTCVAVYNGNTVYENVTWSIISGGEYARIDNNGRITILSTANNSSVTVRSIYQGHTAETTISMTYKSGASSTTNTETIENKDGTTSTITTTIVDNGDGTSTSTSNSTIYDENGSVLGSTNNETVNNADGSSESITTKYDANGNETGHETQNVDTSNNISTQVVEKDANGNDIVTKYTIDTTGNVSGNGMGNEGDGGVDTQFIPFDGSSAWQLDITAYFKYSEQVFVSSEGQHATLVNLMEEINPWPGMVIRYERNVGSVLRVVVDGRGAHSTAISEPNDSIYSLRITYQNKTVTVYNKKTNETVESYSYDLDTFDMVDTTVRLFASYNPATNSEWRYGKGKILDFSIKKI